MYSVVREIAFCYGHRLLNYSGKCRHLHGHNGRIEIELITEQLDSIGMVRDFEEIKSVVQVWIDQNLDHRLILCKRDPLVPLLAQMGEAHYVIDDNPTAEVLAKMVYDYADSQGLPVRQVTLWETPKSCATYRKS